MLEIKEKGYVNKDYMSTTWDNAQQALAEGKAAMYVNLSNTMDELIKKYPDKVDDLGMFAFPFKGNGEDIVGLTGTNGIFAFKGEKEEAAMRFINYFESIPVQNKYFGNQGGIPAIIGVTETKLSKAELDGKALVDAGKANAMWGTGLKYGFGDFGALCQDLLTGKKTSDQVLESVNSEFQKNAKSKADENFK
jgi:raffinose/stachyose/melibiose transport system substrate-binding protein